MSDYLTMLKEFAGKRSLTLQESQMCAGKMQRLVLTLPPGAQCLCANMYTMVSGLKLPWQRKRLTKGCAADLVAMCKLSEENLGMGYFSYDQFGEAPECRTDAYRKPTISGGGWCDASGPYSFHVYGTSAGKQPIDYLEGDTLLHCAQTRGHSWRKKVVKIGFDNTSFLGAKKKGWSHAQRLQQLVVILFELQIRGEFLIQMYWL